MKTIILAKERDRTFYDADITNKNSSADIALVGLCPGYTQLTHVLENTDPKAARSASFKGCMKNISRMLRKIGIDRQLGIVLDDDYDFNSSRYFLTTSLVRYPGLKEGKGRSDDFDPLKYNFSEKCIRKIFLKEMLDGKMHTIVIFGKKAEHAIKNCFVDGKSIESILINSGKQILYLPHPSGSNNGGVARFLRG